MSSEGIAKDKTMQEILQVYPGAQRAMFSRYHIGGCSSCGFEPSQTLAEVCLSHNLWDVAEVVRFLCASHETELRLKMPPEQVMGAIRKGEAVRLLDLRGPEEFVHARIEGARLVTEEVVQEVLDTWSKDASIVIYDHRGERSVDAANFLLSKGFTNVRVLDGGIDAWAEKVDPSIPRYAPEPAHTK